MKIVFLYFVNSLKLVAFGMLVSQIFLSSCSSKSHDVVEKVNYVAFRENEEDRWGLIDWEGNILISDEFQNMPTFEREGVFFVTDENNLFDLYTAEKKFKKISGGYKDIRLFNEGLAAVVEPEKHIKYINTKGETVFELTDYKGEQIIASSSFYDGKAIIMTDEEMYGYIDKKGKVVIPPVYDKASLFYDGYALVKKDGIVMFIDENQKEIVKFDKGIVPLAYPREGSYPYIKEDSDECGIRKLSGEDVIKADKKYTSFSSFFNGYTIFTNSENMLGLMDMNGEVIIRAKYESLLLCDDIIIYRDKGKEGLLSYNGDIILEAKYTSILPFFEKNKYTYVMDGNECLRIDRKGKEVNGDTYNMLYTPSYYYLPSLQPMSVMLFLTDSEMVKSDYIDMDAEADKILSYIKDTGIDRVPYNVSPGAFADSYNKDYKVSDLKESTILSHTISITDNYELTIYAFYDEDVIVPNYGKEWHDSYFGGYYEDVVTGYSYNVIRSKFLSLEISLTNRFERRKKSIFDSLCKGLENKGFIKITEEHSDNEEGNLSVKYEKKNSELSIHMKANPDSESIVISVSLN